MTPATPELDLRDIQGNVLQGYGLHFAHYLFVRVVDRREGSAFVQELADQVTTSQAWSDEPEVTLNVAVTAAGLEALGLPPAVLATFPSDFRQGMRARAERVLGDTGDSSPSRWQAGLGDGRGHLLIMLNARFREGLETRLEALRERVDRSPGLEPAHEQRAEALPGAREHFGFADGFSQPSVEGAPVLPRPGEGVPERLPGGEASIAWRPLKAGEFVLGYEDEDGCLPPAPAVPYGRNGTFMVYRKLYQDVARFREAITVAAEAWGRPEELVAAKVVGRWSDGSPLVLAPDEPRPDIAGRKWQMNDFGYAGDPRGKVCPLGAHVRRANPRDGLFGGGARTRRHRILRRGMPYGRALPEHAPDDGEDRGLVFVCFNASITRQFETVNTWLLDGNHVGIGPERDFLLGVNEEQEDQWMTIQGDPPRFLSPLRPLVITRGGEYLFLPGVTALRAIAAAGGA